MSVVVRLYSRAGCHLCDVAKDVVLEVARARAFELEIVDVDTDPALVALFGDEVPVVMVNGRKVFKFRVDPAVLNERLDRAEQEPGATR